MTSVILKDVVKKFGNTVAVDRINLEIGSQEFVVLVGPSGCGKTTTLRMIAGLEEISDGTITIGDKVVNDLPPKDRDIAMVFQNYALYPHVTIYENMAFALRLRKKSKEYIDEKIKEAAKILDIGHLLHRKPGELSGGQKQRVAIGRAIVREPQVFLMDEPLSNLDAKLRIQMRAEISRLYNRLKVTTVYVTHDQVEAMTMATRIVVMKDGTIHQVDTPQNVYDHPINKFVASFIGSPPMNFMEGHLEQDADQLYFAGPSGRLQISEKYKKRIQSASTKNVIMGIRPEHLSLCLADTDTESNVIKGEVDVIEPLGSEQMVYMKINDTTEMLAKLDPSIKIKSGNVIYLKPDLDKLHYFSAETEESLLKSKNEDWER